MTHILRTPRQAEDAIARLMSTTPTANVEVSESQAFKDSRYLAMGNVRLIVADEGRDGAKAAVRQGSYEWSVPDLETTSEAIRELLELPALSRGRDTSRRTDGGRPSAEVKFDAALEAISRIAARVGLIRPIFDAHVITELPFRRPATVVADTSAVLQGALDFVSLYLTPMARIKIPAILHMEVINQADRFLKTRRRGAKRVDQLAEHLQSQTAQRALIRLEMRSDTEIERNLLLGDPLRAAFKDDRDPDLRDLNLSVPLKSYVDRLILETARQHQSYVAPNHPIYLITADQGLAKMALTEGIRPMYFRPIAPGQFFGRRMTGVMFHPFKGGLSNVPLSALVWELATAFGKVRLSNESGESFIEVVAIDHDLRWSSYHSRDDLLWFLEEGLRPWPIQSKTSPVYDGSESATLPPSEAESATRPSGAPVRNKSVTPIIGRVQATRRGRLAETNKTGVPYYRINVKTLVQLILVMAETARQTEGELLRAMGLSQSSALVDYKRFLVSAEMVTIAEDQWTATESFSHIFAAVQEGDALRFGQELRSAPSYKTFEEELIRSGDTRLPVNLPIPPRVLPSYFALGEVTCACAGIPREGFFSTPNRPTLSDFVDIARQCCDELSVGGWTSVGQWLEQLIRANGIHPVVARDLLREASAARLVAVATEGSTTDTRHEDHTVRVLGLAGKRPLVEIAHLYRGDFLIPEKSSTSMRLEAPRHEPS